MRQKEFCEWKTMFAEAKGRIREELRYFGMEGELVYPELSNVCDELKNRFVYLNQGKIQ